MKYRRVLAALLVVAAAAIAHAQPAVHKATGMVTKVDKDKVMIKHEPVRTLSWPGMTMTFIVKDKALMAKLAKDRKIDFEFRQEGRDYVMTSVK